METTTGDLKSMEAQIQEQAQVAQQINSNRQTHATPEIINEVAAAVRLRQFSQSEQQLENAKLAESTKQA